METWIESEEKYQGKIFSLKIGNVRTQGGRKAQRDIIEHPGGVAIVPVIDESIMLVRQFRISIEREIIELPAGKLEEGESPEECAHRELIEEIGYRAKRLTKLVAYYSSVGFTNEKMYIFLAEDLEKTDRELEWDENIQEILLPIKEIKQMLERGKFEDSKTIIGLFEYLAHVNSVK